MKIIVCLGNPGAAYLRTRHNIGFRVGDAIVDQFSFERLQDKFKSQVFKGVVSGEPVIVIFPQTFMNLSGEAVQSCLSWYKSDISDLLVVYDDIDIAFGTLRFRKQGGPGTHNGLKSITKLIDSRAFPRLRFGIGFVPGKMNLADFVLARFNEQEETDIPFLLDESVATIQKWIENGDDAAIRYASAVSIEVG